MDNLVRVHNRPFDAHPHVNELALIFVGDLHKRRLDGRCEANQERCRDDSASVNRGIWRTRMGDGVKGMCGVRVGGGGGDEWGDGIDGVKELAMKSCVARPQEEVQA